MIKYMNGSVLSNARYMNGVGFEIPTSTPVPQLPASYPTPLERYIYCSKIIYQAAPIGLVADILTFHLHSRQF